MEPPVVFLSTEPLVAAASTIETIRHVSLLTVPMLVEMKAAAAMRSKPLRPMRWLPLHMRERRSKIKRGISCANKHITTCSQVIATATALIPSPLLEILIALFQIIAGMEMKGPFVVKSPIHIPSIVSGPTSKICAIISATLKHAIKSRTSLIHKQLKSVQSTVSNVIAAILSSAIRSIAATRNWEPSEVVCQMLPKDTARSMR